MKIFAISDIHSFYDEMRSALKSAGFEENNPNHLLVCCGDYFDRGPKPWEVLQYLTKLKNVILVRGNHEDLLEQMLLRGFPMDHDKGNGTEKTFWQLLNHCEDNENSSAAAMVYDQIVEPFLDKMVNFYETKNYVFVHGYVPTLVSDHWRTGVWRNARWRNGFDEAILYGNPTGKTIVFGHWHCSYGNNLMTGAPINDINSFDICYFKENTIGIDACTAFTKKVNVLVVDDELLEVNDETN